MTEIFLRQLQAEGIVDHIVDSARVGVNADPNRCQRCIERVHCVTIPVVLCDLL